MDGWPGITYRVNCMAYLSYIIYLLLILYWLLSCIIFWQNGIFFGGVSS